LTSYANLTLALFLNNQQRAENRFSNIEGAELKKSTKERYDEMMTARGVFEKILKDAHVLK